MPLTLSDRLRARMDQLGLTATDVAKRLGCTPRTIRNYLAGERRGARCGRAMLERIADAVGVPVEYLESGTGAPASMPAQEVGPVVEQYATRADSRLILERQRVALGWFETDALVDLCRVRAEEVERQWRDALGQPTERAKEEAAPFLHLRNRLLAAWGDGDAEAGERCLLACRAAYVRAQNRAQKQGATSGHRVLPSRATTVERPKPPPHRTARRTAP